MPIEKSLQRLRPRQDEAPACQARRSSATNWMTSPSRRMRKCDETFSPLDFLEVRVRVGVEAVGEQPLDRVAAVLAGRQADAMMNYGRLQHGRTLVASGEWTILIVPGFVDSTILHLYSEPLHPVAQLPESDP